MGQKREKIVKIGPMPKNQKRIVKSSSIKTSPAISVRPLRTLYCFEYYGTK